MNAVSRDVSSNAVPARDSWPQYGPFREFLRKLERQVKKILERYPNDYKKRVADEIREAKRIAKEEYKSLFEKLEIVVDGEVITDDAN